MKYVEKNSETFVFLWLSTHENAQMFLKNNLDLQHIRIQVHIFSHQKCFLTTSHLTAAKPVDRFAALSYLTSTKKVEKTHFPKNVAGCSWIYP